MSIKVTPILDREDEPDGGCFETATDLSGFALDDATAGPGESVTLPPWRERRHGVIDRASVRISRHRQRDDK